MRRNHRITALATALLASACATASPPPAKPRADVRVSAASPAPSAIARQQNADAERLAFEDAARAVEQASLQAELAQQQAELAQERASEEVQEILEANEEAALESDTDLEKLETDLADTRRELVARGDTAPQTLRDREVALQARIDVLLVERDRAEKKRHQGRQEPRGQARRAQPRTR